MRLLNITRLRLELFTAAPPKYAVVSHRWTEKEVTLEDMRNRTGLPTQPEFSKILHAGLNAKTVGLEHMWIDTCCIDRNSHAELSDAINSMFQWYCGAEICLVYLEDVSSLEDLGRSEWFRRGWTLLELVAPKKVVFFDR
ncbi:Heterokaryon incompatibility [Metarhizium album ARSEF 1941]|uniref:Heterokaryon incompatibility n=1 Tax=Metarhizium album (strain ARSEF 1941) TaxID=1081103 RepID=A0A0B2X691_METAS|nr:Heterokaryon incompatibility [Metarhizium album ARSEF 1941]KHO01243.1 Heterokaryon incompatibility [Metarhizium album ARSEF 1941]